MCANFDKILPTSPTHPLEMHDFCRNQFLRFGVWCTIENKFYKMIRSVNFQKNKIN